MDLWLGCFAVGLLASLSATEIVRLAAVRLSAVDCPGGRRLHRRPTPRLGGLGIFWGFGLALLVANYTHPEWGIGGDSHREILSLLVGGGLMVLVGLHDDIRGLRWPVKLAMQGAAAVGLFVGGWRIESLALPGLGIMPAGSLSLPLTVGWVVLVTNAVNLIDGLDGLACGVALVASAAALILLGTSGGPDQFVAVALAGALLGFLWYNLNPALIFMGDAGSLLVGFVLSAVTMRSCDIASPGSFPVLAVLLLIVPLYDTCEAICRRTLKAALGVRSPRDFLRQVPARVFAADGSHVHHRLVESGLTVRWSVALLWGVAASFALLGILYVRRPGLGLAVGAFLGLAVWGALRWRESRRSALGTVAGALAAAPETAAERDSARAA